MTNSEARKRLDPADDMCEVCGQRRPVSFGYCIDCIPKAAADMVNKPAHYTALGATCSGCGHGIECIDVTKHLGFLAGNVIKYVWRADHKGTRQQDLEKARAYLDMLIEQADT